MKCADPTPMSPAERLAELGELLAAGIQRFLARQCKSDSRLQIREERLDALGGHKAPCGSTLELPA